MDQDSVMDDQESIQEDTDCHRGYVQLYDYIRISCSGPVQKIIRRKAKQFVVEDSILFYIKKSHGKVIQ